MPLIDAAKVAPREPGVYQARVVGTADVIYIGMAGERSRNGKVPPKGLRARIKGYESGRVLTNGLVRAALTRALRDPGFRKLIAETELNSIMEFGRLAFDHAQLEIRWTTTEDGASARALEDTLIHSHEGLWNRRNRVVVVKLDDET